jgi:hypothetical protein
MSIRSIIRKYPKLRFFVGNTLASSGYLDRRILNFPLSDMWKDRIQNVLDSSDNSKIQRVEEAGKVKNGKQVMHNGLLINLGSYYGPEYAQMLVQSKGVHEPQEEYVFQEVLKYMPKGAKMLELGAYWSFYSMWFNQKVDDAVNIMVEPEDFNLLQGKSNFKLNGMQGTFLKGFIGQDVDLSGDPNVLTVDHILETQNIDHLDILHSDIQGFEHDMLKGAEKTLSGRHVDYIFISTHNDEVHAKCLEHLESKDFLILANADMKTTYSEDGLIVGRRKEMTGGLEPLEISLKS